MSAAEWSGKVDERVPVGARVKLTGVFLKNTGQRVGGDGAKVWTVVAHACSMCESGRYVAVDEYPIELHLAEIAVLEEDAREGAEPKRGRAAAIMKSAGKALAEVRAILASSYTPEEVADPRAHPRHFAVANLMPEHPRTPRPRYFP